MSSRWCSSNPAICRDPSEEKTPAPAVEYHASQVEHDGSGQGKENDPPESSPNIVTAAKPTKKARQTGQPRAHRSAAEKAKRAISANAEDDEAGEHLSMHPYSQSTIPDWNSCMTACKLAMMVAA